MEEMNIALHVSFVLSIPDAGDSGCSLFAEASWFCQISRLFPVNFSQGKLAEQEEVMQYFLTMCKRLF